MSGKKKTRGGRKQTQRVGRQMSKADKTLNTNESDDHMGRRERLRKDVPDNNRHINKYRKEIGLPDVEDHDQGLITPEPADAGEVSIDEDGDRELVDSDLIVCIRLFDKDEDGRPVGQETDEDSFCARHREVRRTRSRYKEIGGAIVEVGKAYTTRKEKSRERAEGKRKATGVLKSIMVRLMPHEAEMAGVLEEPQIAVAVDRVALAYQEATGCEVISAAVHRMKSTDLHIHLQYCMVQSRPEREREYARRFEKWKKRLTNMAREALKKEGHPNPGPVKVSNKKKQLLEGKAIEPAPESGVVWQKVAGKRSMRDDSILGYSLRNKLNLVRAAEACGEHDLARKVALKNDYRNLCVPIAKMDDNKLNARYRDLWLERTWRSAIAALLPDPEITLVKIKELGMEAATNYLTYGTTQVELTHLRRRDKELKKQAKSLAAERQKLKAKETELEQREKQLAEDQTKLRIVTSELESAKEALNNDRETLNADKLKMDLANENLNAQQEKLKQDKDELKNDQVKLKKEQDALDKERSKLTASEERVKQEQKKFNEKNLELKSASAELGRREKHVLKSEKDQVTRERAVKLIESQNAEFAEQIGKDLEKLENDQKKLKSDQDSLALEKAKVARIQEDANSYQKLKSQVVVVWELIKKAPEIVKQMAAKTDLGEAIIKLAKLAGVKMSGNENQEID